MEEIDELIELQLLRCHNLIMAEEVDRLLECMERTEMKRR